jgi:hypothetical protein
MSSRQLRKQARQNGAKAAGTKSPAGIQQSSKNSLKHGLTSSMIVLSNESHAKFDELHQTYIETFQPANGVEMDLIDQMVASQWRLRRIWIMQTAALDLKMDQQDAEIAKTFHQIDQATRLTVAFTALANGEKSLDLLLRYETTYTRLYQRAMNTLTRLRRDNQDNQTDENRPEPITSDKLRNDPPPPAAEPVSSPEIIPGSPEFAKMITQMSPEALKGYLSSLKSQCEASEPQPESTE